MEAIKVLPGAISGTANRGCHICGALALKIRIYYDN